MPKQDPWASFEDVKPPSHMPAISGDAGAGDWSQFDLVPEATGRVTSVGRPVFIGEDGQSFSERTETIQAPDGRWFNVPTVGDGGAQLRDIEDLYRKNGYVDTVTGRPLSPFASVEEAVAAAQSRSNGLGDELSSEEVSSVAQPPGPALDAIDIESAATPGDALQMSMGALMADTRADIEPGLRTERANQLIDMDVPHQAITPTIDPTGRAFQAAVANTPTRSYYELPETEVSPVRQVINRLFGDPDAVDPVTGQTEALLTAAGSREGMSGEQYRRELQGGNAGIPRYGRDALSGAIRTIEGIVNAAGGVTDSSALLTGGSRISNYANDLMPPVPAGEQPGFADQLAAGAGSTLTFFVPGLGIARGMAGMSGAAQRISAATGASVTTVLEAAAEAGNTYAQLRASGTGDNDSDRLAGEVFLKNLGLLYGTNRIGLFGEVGNKTQQSIGAAVGEGFQEVGQNVVQNQAMGEDLTQGAEEAGTIGAIVGGLMKRATTRGNEADQLNDVLNNWNNEIQGADLSEQGAFSRAAAASAPQQPQGEPGRPAFEVQRELPNAGVQPPDSPRASPIQTDVDEASFTDYQPPTPAQQRRVARIQEQREQLRDVVLPPNFEDPRLSRVEHRTQLAQMPGVLETNGGIVLIPKEGAQPTSNTGDLVYDYGAEQLTRSSSVNPEWFKNNGWTKAQVTKAVDNALTGKRLGKKQAEIVTGLLDTITQDRKAAVPDAKDQRTSARWVRQAFGQVGDSPGEYAAIWEEMYADAEPGSLLEPDQYIPEYTDEPALTIQELGARAEALDPDGYGELLDSLSAGSLESDEQFAAELFRFIEERTQSAGSTSEGQDEAAPGRDEVTGESAPGGAQGASEASPSPETFELEQQTEGDLMKQAAQDAARTKAESERAAATAREEADGAFTLTGSDSESDQAAAKGQSDMFAAEQPEEGAPPPPGLTRQMRNMWDATPDGLKPAVARGKLNADGEYEATLTQDEMIAADTMLKNQRSVWVNGMSFSHDGFIFFEKSKGAKKAGPRVLMDPKTHHGLYTPEKLSEYPEPLREIAKAAPENLRGMIADAKQEDNGPRWYARDLTDLEGYVVRDYVAEKGGKDGPLMVDVGPFTFLRNNGRYTTMVITPSLGVRGMPKSYGVDLIDDTTAAPEPEPEPEAAAEPVEAPRQLESEPEELSTEAAPKKPSRDRDPYAIPDSEWFTGAIPDRSAPGMKYLIMVRADRDPERGNADKREQRDWGDPANRDRTRYLMGLAKDKPDQEEIRDHLMGIMSDGEPRTFNHLVVDAFDRTADMMGGRPPEEALWSLVDDGTLAFTREHPIFFRLAADVPGAQRDFPTESAEDTAARAAEAAEEADTVFIPTHELADGTQVQAGEEQGVWVDEQGVEIEDDSATPIQAEAEAEAEAEDGDGFPEGYQENDGVVTVNNSEQDFYWDRRRAAAKEVHQRPEIRVYSDGTPGTYLIRSSIGPLKGTRDEQLDKASELLTKAVMDEDNSYARTALGEASRWVRGLIRESGRPDPLTGDLADTAKGPSLPTTRMGLGRSYRVTPGAKDHKWADVQGWIDGFVIQEAEAPKDSQFVVRRAHARGLAGAQGLRAIEAESDPAVLSKALAVLEAQRDSIKPEHAAAIESALTDRITELGGIKPKPAAEPEPELSTADPVPAAETVDPKVLKAADKLAEQAAKMRAKAEEKQNAPRLTNTRKRAQQAEQVGIDTRNEIAAADTIANVAAALKDGTAGALSGVTTAAQIQDLRRALKLYLYRAGDKTSVSEVADIAMIERNKIEQAANLATLPEHQMHGNRLSDIAKELREVKGAGNVAKQVEALVRKHGKERNIALTEKLAKAILDKGKGVPRLKWPLSDLTETASRINRMQRAGITTNEQLREALIKIAEYSGKALPENKTQKLERELVGTKIPGFFPTPPALAKRMAEDLDIDASHNVLDPSAGSGNLMDAAREAQPEAEIWGVEVNATLADLLEAKGHNVEQGDFMDYDGAQPFDRIIMNPPYEKNIDIQHVQHAYELLAPGGRMAALVGEGAFSRSGKTETGFREWLEEVDADVEKLPANTFMDRTQVRTTGTNARYVFIEKPGADPEVLESRSPGRTRPVLASAAGSPVLAAAGATYVPLVEHMPYVAPTTQPKKADRDPVKRREEIIEQYAKELGITLHQGRIAKRSRMLGFFRPFNREIRLKRHNDLEVAAHEIAHYLDYTNPELRKQWRRDPYRTELKGVSYDDTKVYEGFAEWMRLWMTQPTEAIARAPEWTNYFEGWLANTADAKTRKAVENARDNMREWFAQTPVARLESKIGGQALRMGLASPLARFRQGTSDDLAGVLAMERTLTESADPMANGAYETARLTRAAVSIVDGALRHGQPVATFKQTPQGRELSAIDYKGISLEDVLAPLGEDLDDFINYAVSVSASELMDQGRENLLTKEEIQAGLALNNGRERGDDNLTDFERGFQAYQEWNKGIVDFAVSMGIINRESRSKWQREMYIPFYRVTEPSAGRPTTKGGIEGNNSFVHRLTGGTGNLQDIITNMVMNAEMLITGSLRNEARRRIASLASNGAKPGSHDGGMWLTRIPKETKPQNVSRKQLEVKMLTAVGLPPGAADSNSVAYATLTDEERDIADGIKSYIEDEDTANMFWLMGQDPSTGPGDKVMAVMTDGEATFYEVVDPTLWRSIQSLRRPDQHPVVRVLDSIRRFGQASVTLSVDFMTANMVRDTAHGWAFSRGGFRPVIDSFRGFKSAITQDTMYQQWRSNGGDMASYLMDEHALRRSLEGFYARRGFYRQHLTLNPMDWLTLLEKASSAFEASTRMGEFTRSIERGDDPRHAAYLSREVSSDFSMRGDSQIIGFMYDTVLFLKAAINGIDRAARGFASPKERSLLGLKTSAIAMTSGLLYLWNRGNPCYDDLPDWDKDAHWHLFIPGGPDGGNTQCERDYMHFRIPKIWEIGAMASMTERMFGATVDAAAKETGADAGKLARDMFRITADQMKLDFVPFVVAPLADVYGTNKDFTGRYIVSPHQEDLPPSMQSDAYTSPTFRAIGEASAHQPRWMRDAAQDLTGDRGSFEMSPKRMEALWRGYTNTMGLYAQMVVDGVFAGNTPDRDISQWPVARRFLGRAPRRVQATQDLYEVYNAAKGVHQAFNAGAKRMQPELAEVYARDPRQLERGIANSAVAELRKLNQAQSAIYVDPKMSGAEKRKRLNEINEAKNQVALHAMEIVKQVRRKARESAK